MKRTKLNYVHIITICQYKLYSFTLLYFIISYHFYSFKDKKQKTRIKEQHSFIYIIVL